MVIGSCLVLAANAVAAISQLMLKLAARRTYQVWWKGYLNFLVITAYGLFFATTIMNAIAMRFVPLSWAAALGASGQIFVPVISSIFLKEKISRKRIAGMALIVLGIILFSLRF